MDDPLRGMSGSTGGIGSSIDPIPPVPEGTPRPRWSVMIPTYNCAEFLRDTLRSVLAQDPGPEEMQIEVVDDCSSADDPEAVVREMAGDRVEFHRQPRNVGHTGNFDTCIRRARGHLIHLLHGDDVVLPGFYRKMQVAFEPREDGGPEVGMAFCRHIFMDEDGQWTYISALEQPHPGVMPDWFPRIAVKPRIQAPSVVVRRSVYEDLGGFNHRIERYGEDWEMWARIASRYAVWFEPEPLAAYRSRSVSLSGSTLRTGRDMVDLRRAAESIRNYLPPDEAPELERRMTHGLAGFALKKAMLLVELGDMRGATVQIREALRCALSLRVGASVALISAYWLAALFGLRLRPGSVPYTILRGMLP